MDIQSLAEKYQNEILQNVVPFWEKNAFDPLYGGVYEAISESGEVLSTDKNVGCQWQAVWTFSVVYHTLEPRPEWLELARRTAAFAWEKGRHPKGNWYQKLDRRGVVVAEATDYAPALLATMALGQLFRATGEGTYAETAQKLLTQTLKRRDTSLRKQRADGTKRYLKPLADGALIGRALLESEAFLDRKVHKGLVAEFVHELMNDFYDKRTDILLDHVTPEGHFWDCPQGRTLVPGRVFEVASCLMELAERTRNRKLLSQMVDLVELTMQAAWDEPLGGFFHKMDIKSLPPLEPDWCHKLWWVQLEALPALLKAHLVSARPGFLARFEQLHEYLWAHFPDPAQGEWYGWLDREARPYLRHKITADKGCFYTIKNLLATSQLLRLAADTERSARSPKVVLAQSIPK
ncbi:AGE family epimerase/isomerase [Rhabdobacter roseus]|uniref:N-acylglucosamine 2-epimerase n=1 Tax=Rhabdobacter roseus TaxID=1655419 RepID=A0A840TNX0_9BACT|nr:AGE family epimerase/isomerase [Rhabdobacter roseus]MBB5285054.1 N-acylglucosamine 2-epimerase [Rhabdobacter roseus]